MKWTIYVIVIITAFAPFLLYSQKIGIGTANPQVDLHIKGDVRMELTNRLDSNQDFITINSFGDISKTGIATFLNKYVWQTKGNISNSDHFLGTLNDQSLNFKVNNQFHTSFTPEGRIGFGITNPERKMVLYNAVTGENNEIVLQQAPQSPFGAFISFDNTKNNGGRFWSIGTSGPLNTSGIAGAIGSLEFYQFDAGPTSRVRMIINPTGNVGIGTNNATARLHVVGSLRLETLNHVASNQDFLTVDALGNVSRMGILNYADSFYWKRNGNIVDANEYVGTNNALPLNFATNQAIRMSITSAGKVGIGSQTPSNTMDLVNKIPTENSELLIKQVGGSGLGAYVTFDNRLNAGGRFWSIGSAGLTNTSGPIAGAGGLEFYQFDANPGERVRMIISPSGNVGINEMLPQARLDVKGNVRFSDLPSGTGNVLVISSDGRVLRSAQVVTSADIGIINRQQQKIDILSEQIEKLQSQVVELLNKINNL
ncbi:hypothetical protein [Phnomibacter sp. MR]|uniref:hypothetical protein n=1 Tax=Phnomibacter sp. MR TaxID=3042318 RepID=UPI003A807EAC